MSNYIQSSISASALQDLSAQLNKIAGEIKPFSVTVRNDDKTGTRTMAEGREGYVRLVEKIALQHEGSLSRSDDPRELSRRLQYDSELESVRQALMVLLEMISDTQWANSADIMSLSDRYAVTLQAQRGHDAALDGALSELDEWNKRYANRPVSPVKAA